MNKVVIAVKVVVTGVGTEVARGLLFTEEETAQQNDLTFQILLTVEWNQTKKASVQINGTAAVSMISRAAVCG